MKLVGINLYLTLVAIFLVNLLFKLIDISSQSFWYDEIISVKDTLLEFGHIKHEAEWDANPPFYYYALWIWSKFFGISEGGIRSMSAFFSALAAVLIFILSSRLSRNRHFPVLITILFSIHPYLFFYAQEARCYSLLTFLILLDLVCLYNYSVKPSILNSFFLAICSFLIIYTHYIAGLLLIFQFIYLLVFFRKYKVNTLIVLLVPVLLICLRFTRKQFIYLFTFHNVEDPEYWIRYANWSDLTQMTSEFFVSNVIAVFYFISLALFLFFSLRENAGYAGPISYYKLFIVVLPVLCLLSFFMVGRYVQIFNVRYLLFSIPVIFLSFIIFSDKVLILYSFSICMMIFEISHMQFNKPKMMNYRLAAHLTKQIQMRENVNILIQTHDVVTLFLYYYDEKLFKEGRNVTKEMLQKENIFFADNINDLRKMQFDNKPILFFQTFQRTEDNNKIENYFEENGFQRYSTREIEGVKFNYLKRRSH